ncbi:hypothetical protein FHX48_002337 [Microbacterium halimionae]|uniref:Methane oxygenase PmoA n=1 Tax=Microbacterium halimionae TaxID=1526413 RepID=A0A7W3JQN7_9MICO|nr:PmoA family protein [Microbacterium halimionae]MBA8817239.1 hypothetical protein [Microbacterium halimionae]NII94689.1 hypothetical protein [Microbacterium halimionae]
MSALRLTHRIGRGIEVHDGDTELFRYTYMPDSPQLESPKPYFHPIRTRSGRIVSLFRPHDHVWHKGIAWSLPVVNDENFWGGPTYVRGRSYVQLSNDGAQVHAAVDAAEVCPDGGVRFAHTLDWVTESGSRLFTERRELTASVTAEDTWVLTFETAMTNISDASISIGSPTTRGRENAGYGGLFWRGPRSFTGGTLVTENGSGSGNDLRGQHHEWMAFVGEHDEVDGSALVVMLDAVENPHHPPAWFARSEEFACLNPAPFFHEELSVAPQQTVRFRYGVGVADGEEADASKLASAVRSVVARLP